MNPLLEQFLSESRDFLQGIAENLLALEDSPDNPDLMSDLFRQVHTLKGNSGLFDFPEMTRVLHAAEDLMDAVRDGRVVYSRTLADRLLDAMDFVSALTDEIETNGRCAAHHGPKAAQLAQDLRALLTPVAPAAETSAPSAPLQEDPLTKAFFVLQNENGSLSASGPSTPASADAHPKTADPAENGPPPHFERQYESLSTATEAVRFELYEALFKGKTLFWLAYHPEEESFYKGEDPFFQVAQLVDALFMRARPRHPWPERLADLDPYRCVLDFEWVSSLDEVTLDEHFRYTPEQIERTPLLARALIAPQGEAEGGLDMGDFIEDVLPLVDKGDTALALRAAQTQLELCAPDLWVSSVLRWLVAVLTHEPKARTLQKALIESLASGTLAHSALWAKDTVPPLEVTPAAVAAPASVAPAAKTPVPVAEPVAEKPRPLPSAERKDGNDAVWSCSLVLETQREILNLTDSPPWFSGRLRAVAASCASALASVGHTDSLPALDAALDAALAQKSHAPLLAWLENQSTTFTPEAGQPQATGPSGALAVVSPVPTPPPAPQPSAAPHPVPALTADITPSTPAAPATPEASPTMPATAKDPAPSPAGLGAASADADARLSTPSRRSEESMPVPKTLKVDQVKIDRLMNLIGEMVVAKNALPYLAGRAEAVFGVRELSREIKAQYSVINRIAEEMQDAIMQVRMMPVSFIFQRFPRLVRDIARRLEKDVHLVMEGENTEADKNIIESLADPLIHIVRNSLDHGLELPQERQRAGKPVQGLLTIRATQESDRVIIEIADDGRGIDPAVIKQKAYERGLIDEPTLERLTDEEAVQLVFAAGFSTAPEITDLSGRGVGMDVVRNAIAKVNGQVQLASEKGKGTRLRLSLPLSMAVSNVMIVESDGQPFGVPMDAVVETVRVAQTQIRTIKQRQTTVLRGRIVPLVSLNALLGLPVPQCPNEDGELAALVVRIDNEHIGILVDDFRETVDIILKPLSGILASLGGYAGSALLGDGSVLMVLDPKELF